MDRRTQNWIVAMNFAGAAVTKADGPRARVRCSQKKAKSEIFAHHGRDVGENMLQTTKEQSRRPTIQELMSQERWRLLGCGKLAN